MNSHALESSNFKNLVPLAWDTERSCRWPVLRPRVPGVQLDGSRQGSGQRGPSGRGDRGPDISGKSTQLGANILHKGRPSPGGSFPGPGSHPCGHIMVTQQEAASPEPRSLTGKCCRRPCPGRRAVHTGLAAALPTRSVC